VGDEGGFAPNLESEKQALDILSDAIESAGYQPGVDVFLALDVAASSFYKNGKYWINRDALNSEEFSTFLVDLITNFPVFSIEDPYAENDRAAWQSFSESMGKKVQIVGDDLLASSASLLRAAIQDKIANAILIKPNQVGTLTEIADSIKLAAKHGYNSIMSHRSGETEDFVIAHLAMLYKIGQIKTGALCRGERVIKYNELLRIEESLGNKSIFYGEKLLEHFIT
jgi:enolase